MLKLQEGPLDMAPFINEELPLILVTDKPFSTEHERPQALQKALALLVDSSALHADTVRDPEERCFALYQSILSGTPAPPLLLMPPAPPSGTQKTFTTAQLLDSPAFFCAFLRAALRASALGQISLILPRIETVQEIRRARRLIAAVTEQLYTNGVIADETVCLCLGLSSAAALEHLWELLEEADLLIVDTGAISHTVTGLMPTLQLIGTAVDTAHALNRFVALTGDLTDDRRALPHLITMGADAFIRPF